MASMITSSGRRYDLPIENPVGGDGRFLPSTPLFAGEQVFDANAHVIEVLGSEGRLLKGEPYHHAYPHCWRHKTPVIFRATPQWFISMDQAGLRKGALDAIAHVDWMPAWGEQRISGMIAGRPDWCVSRQRTWGVPIPLFVDKETSELHPRTLELIEEVARRVERGGIDAWFDLDPATLLGADAARYEKSTDVMDVWFDSGVVHHAVSELRPGNCRAFGSISGGLRSAPRLVPQLALDLRRHARARALSWRAHARLHGR